MLSTVSEKKCKLRQKKGLWVGYEIEWHGYTGKSRIGRQSPRTSHQPAPGRPVQKACWPLILSKSSDGILPHRSGQLNGGLGSNQPRKDVMAWTGCQDSTCCRLLRRVECLPPVATSHLLLDTHLSLLAYWCDVSRKRCEVRIRDYMPNLDVSKGFWIPFFQKFRFKKCWNLVKESDRLGSVLGAMNHYDLEARHWICTSRDVDLVAANCQGNHEKFRPSQTITT